MGVLPAIILRYGKKYPFFKVALAITITHIISSVLITTYGLSVMRGVAFIPMLITRIASCGINLIIDVLLVYILLKTPIGKTTK